MSSSVSAGSASVLVLTLLALGCAAGPHPTLPAAGEERAGRLAREILILDSHIDLRRSLVDGHLDGVLSSAEGHFDWERARAGGLDAVFLAVFVSPSLQGTGKERQRADDLIDLVGEITRRWPDRFALATTPDEVRSVVAGQRMALCLGMENGAPVADVEALEHFQRRGVRYITLTHSENNLICDSSYSKERRWNGLSPWGRELVGEMNRTGVMVDVSHVSDQAFDQVLEESRAPVIASHSGCRHFTPGFERNLDDSRIQRLAAGGGVIQVVFGSAFLTAEAERQSDAAWAAVERYLVAHGLDWDSPAVDEQLELFWAENPPVTTRVQDVADHIQHVVDLAGIDHVGLGSDFDGVSHTPVGLADVSGYPALLAELQRRGYSEDDLRKICGENLLRVWAEVERVAAGMAAPSG